MNKKEEPKKWYNTNVFYAVIVIGWIAGILLIQFSYIWSDAIDKDYLGSITQQEREDILQERENSKREALDNQHRFTNDIIRTLNISVPIWMVLIVLGVLWVFKPRYRRRGGFR